MILTFQSLPPRPLQDRVTVDKLKERTAERAIQRQRVQSGCRRLQEIADRLRGKGN
jgi:hypothetical protein